MHFHNPPHVPALCIYPTTQGIFRITASAKETVLLCEYSTIQLKELNLGAGFQNGTPAPKHNLSFINYSADLILYFFHSCFY